MCDFEWDEGKNKANIAKHGISFEEAKEVFKYPVFTVSDTRKDYKEAREISIGMLAEAVVIVVVHTDRNGRIRLISARKANRKERQVYYGYIEKAFERD